MKLLTPDIFKSFPDVVAAMSLADDKFPGHFSMTINGADKKAVRQNREQLTGELGFDFEKLAVPQQDHTDIVHLIKGEYNPHRGDGVITKEPGWLLGVTVADCVPILLYDPSTGSYAAIHSGWKGSAQNIAGLAIDKMTRDLDLQSRNLLAWIGASAGKESYEVEYDVASQFNPKYSQIKGESKWLFDNKSVVRDQLIDAGVPIEQIEVCSLDTISNPELHSARRDDDSGRMLAVIGVVS